MQTSSLPLRCVLIAGLLGGCQTEPTDSPAPAPIDGADDDGREDTSGGPSQKEGGADEGGHGDADHGTGPDAGAGAEVEAQPDAAAVPLNDVSILLPPTSSSSPAVIKLSDEGAFGVLLPPSMYDRLDRFVRPAPGTTNPVDQESFQLVGVRIDPCFPDIAQLALDPSRCRAQLRVVAQPVLVGFPPSPTPDPAAMLQVGATDDALHLMYELTTDEFTELAQGLRAWSGLEQSLNIDGAGADVWVHPRLQGDARDGEGGTSLRALLLRYVGVDRLSQCTFMKSEGVHAWDFGGFTVEDGTLTALEIHGTDATEQRLGAAGNAITITPETNHARALAPLLGERTPGQPLTLGPDDALPDALQTALHLESPRHAHAEGADCASCHAAFPLRQRAQAMGASIDGLTQFTSDQDLGGTTDATQTVFGPGDATNLFVETRLRAFGWFGRVPVVSQRAVNESAAVTEALLHMQAQ